MRSKVASKDGTIITYEKVGQGDVVILVLGALNSRKSGSKLAKLLSTHFTVVNYDRRGRGDSMHGGAGAIQMHDAAQAISKYIPQGKFLTLTGQTHGVSPKVLAPVLIEFFGGRSQSNKPL